jgi:hypothetical protein
VKEATKREDIKRKEYERRRQIWEYPNCMGSEKGSANFCEVPSSKYFRL